MWSPILIQLNLFLLELQYIMLSTIPSSAYDFVLLVVTNLKNHISKCTVIEIVN
jgi:hypothetical protein